MQAPTLPPAFITQLASSLRDADSLEQMVRPLLELLQSVTGLESTYLTRIDRQAGTQRILFARNSRQLQIPEGLEVEWGDTLCKRALEEGCAYTDNVADRWGDSDAASALGIATYASVPVTDRHGEVFGTLCAAGSDRRPRVDVAEHVLQVFSHMIGQQVERERLVEELRQVNSVLALSAHTDALTGLPNRRALIEELNRRFTTDNASVPLVAFIDLDDFKAINDQHGHDAGDRFLMAMAAALSSAMAPGDFTARLGGDEFVCLTSVAIADIGLFAPVWQARLFEATRGDFNLGHGVQVDYPGASIGVVAADAEAGNADSVLSKADAAMYAAKQQRKQIDQATAVARAPRFRNITDA